MRVLIAGGNGFIGRALTGALVRGGHDVTWLSHTTGRYEIGTASGPSREFAFDPVGGTDDGGWRNELAGADAVVNLSGTPISARWSPRVKTMLRASRIETGRALVDAMRALDEADRPKSLVSASGIGIYGDRGDTLLTETVTPGDDWLSRLARDWEAGALSASASGVRVVTVRTGLVLGDEGFLPRVALPMRLFVGGPVGSGRQWVPWIHHSDIAGVYVHAIRNDALEGPLNAVAPDLVTMRGFAKVLGETLHRPSWLPVPGFALGLVLGEVAPYTLFSQRASAAKLIESGFRFDFPSLSGALRDLLGKE